MFPECPQLRPYLRRVRSSSNQNYLLDDLGLSEPLLLTAAESACLDLFDGTTSVAEIHFRAQRLRQQPVPTTASLQRLLTRLEEGLFLASPRFEKVVNDPVRPPRCIGCYEGEPELLRAQLHDLFVHPQGAGLPRKTTPDGSLRAALIPHIDYLRGGLSYTYAFKELVEKSDASLFVIIGTSHYSSHRFTLTRKHFQTPLGIVPTDQEYIDHLVRSYGDGLFDDEWLAHFPEHSIELEVVFLQYLFEKVRPIRIVPLVVGSFYDCVDRSLSPSACSDIGAMIEALRQAEGATKEPIGYIISGDLAHIGPKFNAAQRLDKRFLERSHRQDQALLQSLERLDHDSYFHIIAQENDERNICGLPPTFATLAALRPRSAKVLNYDRYVHPQGHESVSFASAAFYR